MKLILGSTFIIAFSWILVRNGKRTGVFHALFRIDTVVGLMAGFYLFFTSLFFSFSLIAILMYPT